MLTKARTASKCKANKKPYDIHTPKQSDKSQSETRKRNGHERNETKEKTTQTTKKIKLNCKKEDNQCNGNI